MQRQLNRAGLLCSLPMLVLLGVIFVAPLLVVLGFSVMPPRSFSLLNAPGLDNFVTVFTAGYWRSLAWSLGLALITVVVLLVACFPLAFAMAKVFGQFANVITVLVVLSLFVSENIRLFGWTLILMKGGMIEGLLGAWLGIEVPGMLYNVPVIVFGLVYVYLPFMLFPLVLGIAMIPDELRQAASDLGASRWRVLVEIDIPLAMPGILVGSMLTFVLSAGALAESKLLGGQKVIVMANEIETAFTYGQNWPLGSALSVLLIAIIGAVAFVALKRIDLDRVLGKG